MRVTLPRGLNFVSSESANIVYAYCQRKCETMKGEPYVDSRKSKELCGHSGEMPKHCVGITTSCRRKRPLEAMRGAWPVNRGGSALSKR
jgi:hypothetical protein